MCNVITTRGTIWVSSQIQLKYCCSNLLYQSALFRKHFFIYTRNSFTESNTFNLFAHVQISFDQNKNICPCQGNWRIYFQLIGRLMWIILGRKKLSEFTFIDYFPCLYHPYFPFFFFSLVMKYISMHLDYE